MKKLMLLTGTLLFFISCQSGSPDGGRDTVYHSKDMAPAPSMEESQSYGGDEGTTDFPVMEQKIIRNGSMTIKVDDVLKSKAEVDAILSQHKAYTGNEQFDNTDYSANYHIQIRVPAENLDALVAALESMEGVVTYKAINARDVTEEFIDLETRLTNKRSYLEQYRQLLRTAKTVEDILKVREQIRMLEEEIESVEGRLKYLRDQVALSTLDLTLMQEKDFVYRPDRKINFLERLKDSLSTGWYGFVSFCLYMVGLWPFWIVLFILVWALRKYNRRIKNKK
jgi:hypothetical protein